VHILWDHAGNAQQKEIRKISLFIPDIMKMSENFQKNINWPMFLIQLHLHQFCFKIIQVCTMFFKSVRTNFKKNYKFFQK
jgi:hypothetical protein